MLEAKAIIVQQSELLRSYRKKETIRMVSHASEVVVDWSAINEEDKTRMVSHATSALAGVEADLDSMLSNEEKGADDAAEEEFSGTRAGRVKKKRQSTNREFGQVHLTEE